jgi:4-hydroxy-tetrahydrodipicolinate synthase
MVALATPFRNGRVDEDAFAQFIRFQLDHGTEGLIPIGTTGEAVTMSPDERLRVVRVAVDTVKGKVPVIAGAGSNSTAETVEAVGRVRDAGADGALVVTPYYNKPTQTGLFEHYQAIARAHPKFPLVAYNVPGRTGVDLLPETVKRLCEVPEVVALKEATGNMARALELAELCGDRMTLLSGDDFTLAPFMACGGKGCISVLGNVVPGLLFELIAAARAQDFAKARALQLKTMPLSRLLFVESNPIPTKWALKLMGMFGPDLRLPLTPLSAPNAKLLEEELGRLDIPLPGARAA